jgi:hemerythrin-like domain-containing protein
LPIEVSDSNLLKNLRDKHEAMDLHKLVQMAHGLLDEYNRRLESELRSRRHTAKMLQAYVQAQDRQVEFEEKMLDEYKSKLSKLNSIGDEIEKHRKNMPPDVNPIQMPPLPSAGDLFAR